MTLEPFNLDGPTASPDQLERITWWVDCTLRFAAVAGLCAGIAQSTVVPPVVLTLTSSLSHGFTLSAFVTAFFAVAAFRHVERDARERAQGRRR